jgi:hypothetical protein
VLWAAKVAKMGYRWRLGNGCKVRFWEDVWIGNSSLAIQFWEVYNIVNEQNKFVADLWDAPLEGVLILCCLICGRRWWPLPLPPGSQMMKMNLYGIFSLKGYIHLILFVE